MAKKAPASKKSASAATPVSSDAAFWSLIEDAWAASDDDIADHRFSLLKSARGGDEEARETLQSGAAAMVEVLEEKLGVLDAPTLLAFDRELERKLYAIDREEVQAITDGSDDGFLYCRGFIVALGQKFFEAVDREPANALIDCECEAMCYVSLHVYEKKFGPLPPSGISRESNSNSDGWE